MMMMEEDKQTKYDVQTILNYVHDISIGAPIISWTIWEMRNNLQK